MAYKENKNLKLYYSIGEVAAMFKVSETLLRYWEKEFPTLITPRKSGRQVRQYTEENIEQVRLIYHLVKEKGMTLQGARQMLKTNRTATVQTMEEINRLKAIREELMTLKQERDQTIY